MKRWTFPQYPNALPSPSRLAPWFVAAGLLVAGLGAVFGAQAFVHPKIQSFGRVVCLPDAAEQPRADSRICVDITTEGPDSGVNPGVMKLARFVNIYAGAGREPANVAITAVLHGKATTAALSDAAYAKKFGSQGNPNLPLLRELKAAGLEVYVCGQALAGLDIPRDDVASEVQVAVSALTVNVNRQMDGFAYIPLH